MIGSEVRVSPCIMETVKLYSLKEFVDGIVEQLREWIEAHVTQQKD
ncbi:MAG: hypothetical protein NTX44_09810 [Ignavibacteriales bacterium]|nr:hypothetical protein [Ignavibacteriales bacterium]